MVGRAFSATGKALLAGGYLVLDPEYEAYVVALSARMYALNTSTESTTYDNGIYNIRVDSPQFLNGSWAYSVDLNIIQKSGLRTAVSEISHKRNPFIESVVHIILAYAIGKKIIDPIESKGKNINITIFSDAEYHSQLNSIEKKSDNEAKRFLYHEKEITKVNKTGLGSSAALVTSLTACLLSSLFPDFDAKDPKWKEIVHNLAQIAHCKAQGKIGSGFDVASATFGSIIYKRFAPELINHVLDAHDESIEKLTYLVDEQDWNIEHEQCSLPYGIRLLMGDVVGGSETPKLVTKVHNWKKEHPKEAYELYTNINNSNMKLVKSLQSMEKLSETNPEKYKYLLEKLSINSGDEIINNSNELFELKEIVASIENIRLYLQMLTVETGAEIEPSEQTELLNAVTRVRGVLGGVVPGAGGYDAICLLTLADSVESIVSATAKLPGFSHVRWMNLMEQKEGLVEENPADFSGLV